MAEVLGSSSSGFSSTSGTFHGVTSEGNDVSGDYIGQTYDPSVAQQAQKDALIRQNEREAQIRQQGSSRISEIASFYVDALAIPSGHRGFGGFRFYNPDVNQILKLHISFGNEVHTFLLSYSLVNQN